MENLEELKSLVVNNVLNLKDQDLVCYFDIILPDVSIINARNINARDINAEDINAWNINAEDINAWNINARNINAEDINAWNINAEDISYYAVCFAYRNITCKSINGRKKNSKHFVLDGEIKIRDNN